MRKTAFLLFLVLLAAVVLCGAEEASEITGCCEIRINWKKTSDANVILDRRYSTGLTLRKDEWIAADAGDRKIGGLFIRFFEESGALTLRAERDGEWVDICAADTPFVETYVQLPEAVSAVRLLNTSGKKIRIDELYVYGEGECPAACENWTTCDKADLMLLVAHPDDELLWFGGLLPYYAAERGLKVQTVYATASASRKLELLDGLRVCGVKYYPVFLGMKDRYVRSLNGMYKLWGKERFLALLTEAIRRYRPDVLVTHDEAGEYGHAAHMACADAARECIGSAARADDAGVGAAWQVRKLYLHLWSGDQVRMNWTAPLESLGGESAISVATRALACHKSQSDWPMSKADPYDNSLFGLCLTMVGPDRAGNDLMENIY